MKKPKSPAKARKKKKIKHVEDKKGIIHVEEKKRQQRGQKHSQDKHEPCPKHKHQALIAMKVASK